MKTARGCYKKNYASSLAHSRTTGYGDNLFFLPFSRSLRKDASAESRSGDRSSRGSSHPPSGPRTPKQNLSSQLQPVNKWHDNDVATAQMITLILGNL
jgi:hypothetical protein